MTDLITELKALKEKATPGPVTVVSIGYHREPRLVDSTEKLLAIFGNAEDTEVAFAEWEANAELVAALVNHLPTIIARLEEADRVEAWLVERFMLMAGAGPFCELCHDYLPHKTDCPLSPVRKTTLAALESTHDH